MPLNPERWMHCRLCGEYLHKFDGYGNEVDGYVCKYCAEPIRAQMPEGLTGKERMHWFREHVNSSLPSTEGQS